MLQISPRIVAIVTKLGLGELTSVVEATKSKVNPASRGFLGQSIFDDPFGDEKEDEEKGKLWEELYTTREEMINRLFIHCIPAINPNCTREEEGFERDMEQYEKMRNQGHLPSRKPKLNEGRVMREKWENLWIFEKAAMVRVYEEMKARILEAVRQTFD